MNKSILNKLKILKNRYKEIEIMLTQKNVIKNQENIKKLSKEYLKISKIVKYFINWEFLQKEKKKIFSLLKDIEIQDMAQKELILLDKKNKKLEKKINQLLLPQDPNDALSCFIEIRAATGGDESSMFARELFKMYVKYAESYAWTVEIINTSVNEQKGFKEIILKVTGKGVCGRLKFESGGHRVQRVPETESQGRIHTSTCTVAIMPVVPKSEKEEIQSSDLKIDTFRSSGAGGQHVNTTDSAIRITHIPTGNVVECQDERSQHKNKAKALSILEAKIYAEKLDKQHKKNSYIRKQLLGSGQRSDKNRTYNFPQNRVTDHRINLTVYKLNEILAGKLDLLIDPILTEYHADLLSSLSVEKL